VLVILRGCDKVVINLCKPDVTLSIIVKFTDQKFKVHKLRAFSSTILENSTIWHEWSSSHWILIYYTFILQSTINNMLKT